MRIVLQTPNYFPAIRYGGPIRSCHGLASALVRRGCTIDVVTSNVDGPKTIEAAASEPVLIDGVRVHYHPVNMPERVYASSSMLTAFEQFIPRADLVHINGMFLWPSVQAARVARRENVPYIVAPRGMLAPELVRGKSTVIKRAWIAMFERRILRNAQGIHVTAALEAEGIRQQSLDLAPFIQIPNGVDVPATKRIACADQAIWQQVPRGKRIAFLGRLDWKKGVDIAIEAAKKLPDAFLFLAGPDQIGLRNKFEAELSEPAHADRIRFIGELNDREKWGFLAGADVHIVPSLNENFGNTVIEALAVGTPVLCTPEVGAGELAKQFDTECVVERSADEFSRAIEALFENVLRRAHIRDHAPQWVSNQLSWDAIAGQFIDTISRSIGGELVRPSRMS